MYIMNKLLSFSKEHYLSNGLTLEMLEECLECFIEKGEEYVVMVWKMDGLKYEGRKVECIEGVLLLAEQVNEDLIGEELVDEVVGYIEYELDVWRER